MKSNRLVVFGALLAAATAIAVPVGLTRAILLERFAGNALAPTAVTEGAIWYDSDGGVSGKSPRFNTDALAISLRNANEQAVFLNALVTASTVYGGATLPRASRFDAVTGRATVTGVNGGGTTLDLQVTDGITTCTTTLACTIAAPGNFRSLFTSCSFPIGSTLQFQTGASGCTLNPVILGNIDFEWYWES